MVKGGGGGGGGSRSTEKFHLPSIAEDYSLLKWRFAGKVVPSEGEPWLNSPR